MDFIAANAEVSSGSSVAGCNGAVSAASFANHFAPILRGVIFLCEPHFGAGTDGKRMGLGTMEQAIAEKVGMKRETVRNALAEKPSKKEKRPKPKRPSIYLAPDPARAAAQIIDWDARVDAERVKATAKNAPSEVGPGRGARTDRMEHRSDTTKSIGRGTTYLAARIKRDAPEIAAAVERGEVQPVPLA